MLWCLGNAKASWVAKLNADCTPRSTPRKCSVFDWLIGLETFSPQNSVIGGANRGYHVTDYPYFIDLNTGLLELEYRFPQMDAKMELRASSLCLRNKHNQLTKSQYSLGTHVTEFKFPPH